MTTVDEIVERVLREALLGAQVRRPERGTEYPAELLAAEGARVVVVLPPLTDPALERARLPLWLPLASGGRVDVLADGNISLKEATKMPLGKGISPTVLGLTAADRAIGNGGVYTSPYLVSGVRLADGVEVGTMPRASVRVWDEASASWVLHAMEATVQVEGANAYKAMKGLPDAQRLAIGLKTGTADTFTEVNGRQVSLPSPK